MLSKKQGRSYIVQDYEGDFPRKLNRKKTDKALALLEKSFRAASKAISDLYDDDTELYWFIVDNIWLPDSYYICNDKLPETISDIYRSIKDLQDFLKEHDDEIVLPENYVTLESLGFQDMFRHDKPNEVHVFEKTVKDLNEKEITEEIVLADDPEIIRRRRTTLWDISPGIKSSRSIRYKKLRMTKKLQRAAENTLLLLGKRKTCE